jgi:hypothetical protein
VQEAKHFGVKIYCLLMQVILHGTFDYS